MKYTESNKPLVCMMTNSTCYKGTTTFTPKGVLWHSTGANNPNLKRYVQPSDNASDRAELLEILGTNTNKNDWNHITRKAGLNCWIGKLANGTVATVQTMPWNYKPCGCGSGPNGSCNNNFVQFEICEDSLTDKTYFNKVYQEACEITAYICDMYNIDPNGTVVMNGIKVPTILCHADSYKLGLGSNHGDVLHWFSKHGKTMDDARRDVAALMGKKTSTSDSSAAKVESTAAGFKVGDEVKLVSGATYTSGKSIASWVFNSKLYVREINGDNIVISTVKTGAVTGTVHKKYLVAYNANTNAAAGSEFKSYAVKVTASELNIRKGPGTSYDIVGCIKDKGTYTIVEENNGWGKLKSGAGWISLKYTEKV